MYDAALAARFGDSIQRVYRRADQFVGEVMERVDPKTRIIIVSDHGFHSWRKAVNLNTWLVQQGYMVLQTQGGRSRARRSSTISSAAASSGRTSTGRAPAPTRWASARSISTCAAARPAASSAPAPRRRSSPTSSRARLLTLTDPDDGARIVRAVYKRDDIYTGEFLHNAAELQVGMEDGYRVSWQTTLGGSPQGIVYPNMKKWSGDHGGFDFATTAGVLISNVPVDAASPSIMDIAPTVLKYFGLPVPSDSMANRFTSERPARRRMSALRLAASACSRRPSCRSAARRPRGERRRRPSAPPNASSSCSARPRRSSPKRASCSSSCGSSSSNGRSRSRRSTAIERQRGETARQLEDAQARTDALQLIAEADRPDIESRLVQVYKLGRAGYWRLLLDVEDMRSLGHVYRTAAAMTQIDRERIQGYQRTLDALAKEQATLEARSKELVGLEAQATKARTALDRAVRSREELVASIDRRRDLHAQWTSELEAAQNRLQTSIAQLDDTSLPFRPFQGALPWPARGPISSRFGRQPSSRFGTAIHRNGIEIAHRRGPARPHGARGGGRVRRPVHRLRQPRDRRAWRRRVLALRPPERDPGRRKGHRLEPLSVVGRTGRNPNGTPSLYFELRVDAKPVDPLQWLQKGTP